MSKFAKGRRSADGYPIAKGRFFWAMLLGSEKAVFRVQVKRVERIPRTNQYMIYTDLTNLKLDNWCGLDENYAIPLCSGQLYRDERKAEEAVDSHFDDHIRGINDNRSKVKRRFSQEKQRLKRKRKAA